MTVEYLKSARALESLRTGVPNSTAVRLLGCSQPRVSNAFEACLGRAARIGNEEPKSDGLLIKGGFGVGKSHTLSYLADAAAERGFVVSTISINKETPLSDPEKLFYALANSAELPDRSGAGLFEAGQRLAAESEGFKELERWARSCDELDGRFVASLQLFRLGRRNYEMKDQILRFWCGDPLGVSYVRSRLRELGIPSRGSLRTTYAREMGFQRARFASRLLRAAGYAGWVWLIDEVELVGSYSMLQRMRSYCQIGLMLSDKTELDCPGVVPVLAITDDFDSAVIRGKQDSFTMPNYFRERCQWNKENRDCPPQLGISVIQSSALLLHSLRDADADALHSKLRDLYGAAYNWLPSADNSYPFTSSTTVRQRIKHWITAWDIQRLVSSVEVDLEVEPLEYNYLEPVPADDPLQANDEALIDEIMKALD
jgi:hypothetical protein